VEPAAKRLARVKKVRRQARRGWRHSEQRVNHPKQ
jgi:hypothetical protein